jgi:hypothetical protein
MEMMRKAKPSNTWSRHKDSSALGVLFSLCLLLRCHPTTSSNRIIPSDSSILGRKRAACQAIGKGKMIADPKISNAPITLSQMVALSYTYRIMFKVLVTGPLVLILLQLVFMTSFLILDTITNQHTIITVIATVAITPAIQRQIVKAAPTEDQAAATAKKLRYWSPALVLLACVVLARYVDTPLEDVLRLKTVLTLSPPIIPFATAFRLAIGSFILGFSICARYVGPPSIGTYSSSALIVCITPTDFSPQ